MFSHHNNFISLEDATYSASPDTVHLGVRIKRFSLPRTQYRVEKRLPFGRKTRARSIRELVCVYYYKRSCVKRNRNVFQSWKIRQVYEKRSAIVVGAGRPIRNGTAVARFRTFVTMNAGQSRRQHLWPIRIETRKEQIIPNVTPSVSHGGPEVGARA